MKPKVLYLFLWIGILSSLVPSASYGDAVGLVTASRGPATLVRGEKAPAVTQRGQHIFVGDIIRLNAQSTLQLTFIDGSTISLTGGAELIISDFVFGEGKKPRSKLKVSHGTFSFLAGEIAKIAPESYRIETETATIGIRGSGGTAVTSSRGLLISTQVGHILEVFTISGQLHIIDTPAIGLAVQSTGASSPFPVTQDLWNLRPELIPSSYPLQDDWIPSAPRPYQAPAPHINAQAIYSSTAVEIVQVKSKKKSSSSQVRGSQSLMQEPESSTTSPTMQRLAAEQKAKEEAQAKAKTQQKKRKG